MDEDTSREDNNVDPTLPSRMYFAADSLFHSYHVKKESYAADMYSKISYSAHGEPHIDVHGYFKTKYNPKLYYEIKERKTLPVFVRIKMKKNKIDKCEVDVFKDSGDIVSYVGLDEPFSSAICSILDKYLEFFAEEHNNLEAFLSDDINVISIDEDGKNMYMEIYFKTRLPEQFHLKNSSGVLEYDVNEDTADGYTYIYYRLAQMFGKKHKTRNLEIYELKYRDAITDVIRAAYEKGHCETLWHRSMVFSYCPNDKYVHIYRVNDRESHALPLDGSYYIEKYGEDLYDFFEKRVPDSSFVKTILKYYYGRLVKEF